MYQLKIDGQKVGKLMKATEARKWLHLLWRHFGYDRVWRVKVH